jgi:L-galactose dehydrogenase
MIPTRKLGKTDIHLPVLAFGASSIGAEFRAVSLDEAILSVRTALDHGMSFIDTSPFYGRGMSEVLLGFALNGVPRDSYLLGTKLGRYSDIHFDFSARRVEESCHVSLQRLRTDHLDIMLLHDVEFVPLEQIWTETMPALLKLKQQGKVRAVGFSCYPLKTFDIMLDHVEDQIDCVLSYNRYTLQNTTFATHVLPRLEAKGIGAMNAGPFSARLLTNAELPAWLKEPESVKQAARDAAKLCAEHGVDIAQLALQFSCQHSGIATTIAGSANPANIAKWARWIAQPTYHALLEKVLALFDPVKDIGHTEGLPENN